MTRQSSDSVVPGPERKPGVELEPLVTRAEAPRFVENSKHAPGHDGDYGLPIPEDPLHVCPECEYILTGLTSRRCPECGSPFRLSEARCHAKMLSPAGKLDKKAVLGQRIAFYAGLCLLILGTFAPMLLFPQAASLSIFLMIFCGSVILLGAFLWKLYYQKTWSDAMLLAGIVSGTIGAILILI